MKTLQITIAPNGKTNIETRGFVGSECREASHFVEQALGKKVDDLVKPEFHQHTVITQHATHCD